MNTCSSSSMRYSAFQMDVVVPELVFQASHNPGTSAVLVTVASAQKLVVRVEDSIKLNSVPDDDPPGKISPMSAAKAVTSSAVSRCPNDRVQPPSGLPVRAVKATRVGKSRTTVLLHQKQCHRDRRTHQCADPLSRCANGPNDRGAQIQTQWDRSVRGRRHTPTVH